MDPEPTSPSVFISDASADRERAFEICRYLEDMGHRCWIAPRDIRAGHDYGEEIIRGIERSRCFVLVFSSAANASIYVKRELERAVSKAKPVFPVRLEDVLPSASLELHLASLHFLDAWNGVLRDHVSSLARALSGEGDEIPHRAPSAPPAPPAPWRRHPKAIGADGAAVVVLGALAWWRLAGQPEEPAWQDAAGAGVPGAGTPAVTTAPARRGAVQGAALSGCRPSAGAPVVHCSGAPPGSRVLVSTAQGDEIAIPAGSGADSVSAGGVHRRSTYLPWPGPGGSARVETPDGVVSQEEPLPGAPGLAAAVPLPALDSHAPPLFYAWAGSGWAWLFFAPMDTMEVDWSIDGAAPVRVTRTGVYSGPIALDSDVDGTKSLTLRWRNQAGEWSEPHDYRTDVPAARIASVKSLQDLVGSIACYRVADAPMPAHVRCPSTR
ncbi:MAG: toll/interleukin-1 receptor domain-containing protein, partial [Gammaproteobacteria bacterium]|nr:toll/interleukin-1 receptor domain-containing protein [Gammaproteobacteria bacterium]